MRACLPAAHEGSTHGKGCSLLLSGTCVAVGPVLVVCRAHSVSWPQHCPQPAVSPVRTHMRQMQRSHAQVLQKQAGRLALQIGYLRSAQAAARRQEAKGGPHLS